jgi:hypothetical protein
MKFSITESKLNKVIFNYLNQKHFVKKEINDRIYFLYNIDDEYAQIRYDKNDGRCFIYYKLIEEISLFFSLQLSDSEQVIGKWVEDTLQMEVTNTIWHPDSMLPAGLKIPFKWR